jgi:hypothetical protein
MVASAGKQEGLERKYSIPCLILIAACLVAAVAIHDRYYAITHTALDNSPDVLAHQAREFASDNQLSEYKRSPRKTPWTTAAQPLSTIFAMPFAVA